MRLVLGDDVGGGSGGGEHNDGGSLALVGGQHCADGGRGCVVKPCRLLFALLRQKLINFEQYLERKRPTNAKRQSSTY